MLAGAFEPTAAGRELSVSRGRAEGLTVPSEETCLLEGRIYNLRELAQQLGIDADGPGVDGAGSAPEAVLPAAWRRWGEGMLERLRGDFALLLWNPSSGRGLLARDQLGSGSIYLHGAGRRLVFGSEVSQVLALLASRPGPDEVALAHWLACSGAPAGRTLYAGVRRLGEGRLIRFNDGGWEEDRYWAPRYRPDTEADREAAIAGLRQRLDAAVQRRSRGATMGLMLSGGIDSCAIAGVAAEHSSDPASRPRAYSAVFPRYPRADESSLIDDVVASLGLDSVRIAVEAGSPLAGSLEYLREYELPPSSPNLFFWLPLLRRAAADGMTALMDGEGGDEVMATGYYLLADRIRRGRVVDAVRLARRFPGAGKSPPWRSILSVLRDYGLRGAFRAGRPRGLRSAPAWLAPSMRAGLLESEDPWGWTRAPGPRWWAQLVRALTSASGSVLGRDQIRHRAALAGLEASHPLLDLDLVEFVLGLDPTLAFDRSRARPLLREAVRGLIPDSVRLRPYKSNFDVVFHRGLLETDAAVLERLLGDGAEIRGYLDPEALRRELLGPPGSAAGDQARAIYLWRLATAECWLRSQADPDAAQNALGAAAPARLAISAHPAAARRAPLRAGADPHLHDEAHL